MNPHPKIVSIWRDYARKNNNGSPMCLTLEQQLDALHEFCPKEEMGDHRLTIEEALDRAVLRKTNALLQEELAEGGRPFDPAAAIEADFAKQAKVKGENSLNTHGRLDVLRAHWSREDLGYRSEESVLETAKLRRSNELLDAEIKKLAKSKAPPSPSPTAPAAPIQPPAGAASPPRQIDAKAQAIYDEYRRLKKNNSAPGQARAQTFWRENRKTLRACSDQIEGPPEQPVKVRECVRPTTVYLSKDRARDYFQHQQ